MTQYTLPFYVEVLPTGSSSVYSGFGKTIHEALQVATYGNDTDTYQMKKGWRLPNDCVVVYRNNQDVLIDINTGELYDRQKLIPVIF